MAVSAVSPFVQHDNQTEIDRLYTDGVEQGTELMPPRNHGLSTKFGLVNDQFGVSWQLNLPA
ncbi:VOC family protein [Streptomyces sp. NPDC001231]|uniref:VOC family protein n=1 Tax=Streptomyces sp. NPDC001231 TaxID=3364549 RepID=UPI0036C8B8F8